MPTENGIFHLSVVNKPSIIVAWARVSENWQSAVDYQKCSSLGSELTTFIDIIKINISVGKEKVQFTVTFYLKQNKELQLDLQCFEIFIFLSFLPSLLLGKMLEEKLPYRFLWFGICMIKESNSGTIKIRLWDVKANYGRKSLDNRCSLCHSEEWWERERMGRDSRNL